MGWVRRAWELEPLGLTQILLHPDGLCDLGQVSLSGLRLLICATCMATTASCFSVWSFVHQVPTDICHFPGSMLSTEDAAGKLMVCTREDSDTEVKCMHGPMYMEKGI